MFRRLFAAALAAAAFAAPAQALNTYNWEFTGDPGTPFEGGVVRGTIVLPDGDIGFPEVEIFDFMVEVTEVPVGAELALGGGWSFASGVFEPIFSVENGVVTRANAEFGRPGLAPADDLLYFGTNGGAFFDPGAGLSSFFPEVVVFAPDLALIVNISSFEGPTRFSRADIPLPLPAALLLSGLGALVLAGHGRNRGKPQWQ